MGDQPPEAWSAELQRDGRVVFTVRPQAVLRELGFIWAPTVVVLVLRWRGLGDDRVEQLFAAFVIALAVGTTAWQGWRLASHQTVLTVDEAGLRVGRKRFMPWAEVGAIGLVRGGRRIHTLPILPKDPWGKELIIPQAAVRSVPALAQWLEELLKEHRAADKR